MEDWSLSGKNKTCGLILIFCIAVPITVYFLIVGGLEVYFNNMVNKALMDGDLQTAALGKWLNPLDPVVYAGIPTVAIIHCTLASLNYPTHIESLTSKMVKRVVLDIFFLWWGLAAVIIVPLLLLDYFLPVSLGFLGLIALGGAGVSFISILIIMMIMSIRAAIDVRNRNTKSIKPKSIKPISAKQRSTAVEKTQAAEPAQTCPLHMIPGHRLKISLIGSSDVKRGTALITESAFRAPANRKVMSLMRWAPQLEEFPEKFEDIKEKLLTEGAALEESNDYAFSGHLTSVIKAKQVVQVAGSPKFQSTHDMLVRCDVDNLYKLIQISSTADESQAAADSGVEDMLKIISCHEIQSDEL
jgi:hypothetical protein